MVKSSSFMLFNTILLSLEKKNQSPPLPPSACPDYCIFYLFRDISSDSEKLKKSRSFWIRLANREGYRHSTFDSISSKFSCWNCLWIKGNSCLKYFLLISKDSLVSESLE